MQARVESARHQLDQAREDADRITQEAEKMKQDVMERQACVVCQDAIKDTLLLPCKHLCMCFACASHSQMKRCPICRKVIQDKMKVFN